MSSLFWLTAIISISNSSSDSLRAPPNSRINSPRLFNYTLAEGANRNSTEPISNFPEGDEMSELEDSTISQWFPFDDPGKINIVFSPGKYANRTILDRNMNASSPTNIERRHISSRPRIRIQHVVASLCIIIIVFFAVSYTCMR